MDKELRECFDNLGSTDDKIRLSALQAVLKITDARVDWVYEVWDNLFEKLDHENSYQRSIGILVLCNLAKSDSEHRLDASINLLLAHTRDDKFITSRQCIQNIWKTAAAGEQTRQIVLDHLERRFKECTPEKHYNLIRQDIIQSIRLLYEEEKDDALLIKAQQLVAQENEQKYRKQYETVLKGI
jgi:hypothetical protein